MIETKSLNNRRALIGIAGVKGFFVFKELQGQGGEENMSIEEMKKALADWGITLPEGATDEDIKAKYTELDKKLTSTGDKRVEDALKTAQEKWEKEHQEKVKKEREEATRLAKLSEEEKNKEELSKKEREIAERELQLQRSELKFEAVKILADKKLPIDFADMLISAEADSTKKNIDAFDTAFKKAVEDAVNDRLKSNSPSSGSGNSGDKVNNPWKKETFNLTEQGRIMKENPEQAKILMAQAK